MPEWLQATSEPSAMAWTVLAARLLLALGSGLVVAGVFAMSQRRPAGQVMPLLTTLVLLTILVAMTTLVIGDSVARAFGLVGALSIVRFRTVVEDTRDTAFVIFAVVVGMAIGSGHLLVCLVGIPVVSAAALGMRELGGINAGPDECPLEVRIGVGHDPESLLSGVFGEHLSSWKLVSVGSARQGASIDLHYRVRLCRAEAMLPLVKSLQAIEGVQGVQLSHK